MIERFALRRAPVASGVALSATLFLLAGCAGSSRPTSGANAHASLVLPNQAILDQHDNTVRPPYGAPWEYGRNDVFINYRPYGAAMPYGWAETYTRDRFFTFGGRTHDHSRFEIRSYRIR